MKEIIREITCSVCSQPIMNRQRAVAHGTYILHAKCMKDVEPHDRFMIFQRINLPKFKKELNTMVWGLIKKNSEKIKEGQCDTKNGPEEG